MTHPDAARCGQPSAVFPEPRMHTLREPRAALTTSLAHALGLRAFSAAFRVSHASRAVFPALNVMEAAR